MALAIMSRAFKNGDVIPTRYTCDGEDISPALVWSDAPPGTKSFALICDDPDAPMGTWTHWVIYGISADKADLREAFPKTDTAEGGIRQGLNSGRKVGYNGPCPPPGKPHRYFFKIYALDAELGLQARAGKGDLLKAMEGHILAQADTHGVYQRRR